MSPKRYQRPSQPGTSPVTQKYIAVGRNPGRLGLPRLPKAGVPINQHDYDDSDGNGGVSLFSL